MLGATVQIAKRSEPHTFVVMPQRWMVERSFAWLEKCRRLWKHCERKLNTSLQFVHLAFLALLRTSGNAPRCIWITTGRVVIPNGGRGIEISHALYSLPYQHMGQRVEVCLNASRVALQFDPRRLDQPQHRYLRLQPCQLTLRDARHRSESPKTCQGGLLKKSS